VRGAWWSVSADCRSGQSPAASKILTAFVTYDTRLITIAMDIGLATATPVGFQKSVMATVLNPATTNLLGISSSLPRIER
jgi:hypothetical protein